MAVVSMKQLLEAGVHFGHQTRRWNPKMAQFIFTERNGIYIIDLQKTVKKLEAAYSFVRDVVADGKEILFVGTKKQAADAVKLEAERAGMPFVNARWLGGMMTNFSTIRRRIDRLYQLEAMREDGTFELLPKKEVIKLNLEIERLEKFLGGIREMKKLPGALFIVDPRKERIAVAEARKLKIPIVAIVDTNCDPDEIDVIIPGNDDAIRAVKLIAGAMASACLESRQGVDVVVEDAVQVAPAPVAATPAPVAPKAATPVAATPELIVSAPVAPVAAAPTVAPKTADKPVPAEVNPVSAEGATPAGDVPAEKPAKTKTVKAEAADPVADATK